MNLADDGFGNLIPTEPPPEGFTFVFTKINGQLARWQVGTLDHHRAINSLREVLHAQIKPVLALVQGGRA